MNAAPQSTPPRFRRRWTRVVVGMVVALCMVVVAGLGWLLCTGSGLRFALSEAQNLSHGALQIKQAQGRLIGPLQATSLQYHDGNGTEITIRQLHLDWRIGALLYKRLHITDLRVASLDVTWPAAQETPASSSPFSLEPPIEVLLDHVQIGPTSIRRPQQALFAFDQLELAGRWTSSDIRIDRLALHAPDGYVDLTGQLGFKRRYRGKGHMQAMWKADGTTYGGTLDAQADGRHAQWRLNLTQPMSAQWKLDLSQRKNNAWTATLDAPPFDPSPLLGETSLARLGLNLQGHGDRQSGTLTGQLDLNDYRVALQPLQASVDSDFKTLTLHQLQLTSPQIKGTVNAAGTFQLDAKPLSADLSVDWKDLELPANVAGQILDTQGRLTIKGDADAYHAAGDLTIGPPGKPAKLALNLDGTPKQIQLHTLSLQQPQGHFAASGSLTLQPPLAWQLKADADKFDPGLLFAGWQGSLNADLTTNGTWADDQPDATLDLHKLDGQLRQRPIRGFGHLHVSPQKVVDGSLDLASGSSSVTLRAHAGASNNATLTLAIASLGDWLPGADGRLNGRFQVRGKFPGLAVQGALQGQSLAWQSQTVRQLHLQMNVPDLSHAAGKLDLDASGADIGKLTFRQIRVNAQGTFARHQLTLEASGQPLSASLTLSGALKDQNWSGALTALTLDVQGLPQWRLQQATRLSWDHGNVNLAELCLTAGEPLLCVNGNLDKAGNAEAGYRLHAVPLTLVMDALGNPQLPVSAEGILQGNGKIRRSAAGALAGNATISSPQGRMVYNEHPEQPVLTYTNFVLNATLSPGSQQATVHAILNGDGRLDGQIGITGSQQDLTGQIGLHLDQLAFVELFTDEIANVKGRINGDFKLGGTLQEPAITGQAGIDGFAAEVPDAGLKLTQGHLSLSTANTRQLEINGSVDSGKGTLTLSGIAGLDPQTPTAISLKGHTFTAVDVPAAKVVLSPDLLVRRDAQGIQATGSVRLDSADVNLNKLPGGGVNKASPDVVVVDQPQPAAQGGATPIFASIKVDLGQHTHLSGMGLDGHVSGVLTVNEQPGRKTTGQGQLAVNGTYKAYGQSLNIQQGQLLFASTPIDNPGLNIKAMRSLDPNATVSDGQQVGLQITGTSKRPVLTVFSNPVMDQSDALSYLVTGKPLSQVKGSEGNTVNAAAQALGSATGNLLAKSIGSKLGISDIGVSSNDALSGSSAFTVGKYLSPRLYLSYGVGLFEPGQVITLRYRLSRRWNFEAQNATDFNRASFNYRVEK